MARRVNLQLQCVVADGEHLPFKDGAFACIFCNSVIEHVANPDLLAQEIQRTGYRFFVQTPNGDFPLETHSTIPIPFYQALPVRLKYFLCKLLGASFNYIESVTYVKESQLRQLFPSAQIEYERWFDQVKSFYVYRK